MTKFAIAFLGTVVLAGCTTVGPDYSAPDKPAFEIEWTDFAQANANTSRSASLDPEWWNTFEDPKLSALVAEASAANYDLRQAFLRIGETRAAYRAQVGRRLPEISADGSAQRLRTSENGQIPIGRLPGASPETNLYDLGVGARWEVDLFGRVSRAVEAAGARADVAAELYDGVLIAVQADVATSYLEMRSLNAQIEAVRDSIAAREKSVELVAQRTSIGSASVYERVQAEAGLRELEATLPLLESDRRRAVYRIATLIGTSPAQIEDRFERVQLNTLPDVLVPVGLPSRLIERRPDIREAERLLAAETAEIGVARGNRLPSFALTGGIGVQATDFADVFSTDSLNWSLGGLFDFTLPFMGGDRLNQEVIIAESEAARAQLRYEQSVLTALEDVEASLVLYVELRRSVHTLQDSLTIQRRATRLAKQRYDSGYSRLFEYLEQQEREAQLDRLVAERKGKVAASVVQIYRALGGSLNTGA